jgi:hypothetical protein
MQLSSGVKKEKLPFAWRSILIAKRSGNFQLSEFFIMMYENFAGSIVQVIIYEVIFNGTSRSNGPEYKNELFQD